MTATETAAPAGPSEVETGLIELSKLLQRLERPDLATRAAAAASRLRRPATIVCVVGEFKQGKSSLVNGLLGQAVCPVDDDLATSALTLVKFAEQVAVVVRRRDDEGTTVSEAIDVGQIHEWVSEQGNPRNDKRVERVEIGFPSPVLKQGLVIVDTPGMGGLGAGHAASTLAFLPFADGLVFVSDASAELSAPEIDFLRRATELCPTVLFAQTKIDLYPRWERIRELNQGHLSRHGLPVPMVAISSVVRSEALARKDRGLNERSRFPDLVAALADDVVKPAKDGAAARSANEARGIITLVSAGLESEKAVIADPASTARALAELEAAKQRLDHLKGPGARWSVLVGDRMADLNNNVTFQLRGAMRTISRNMDEMVEGLQRGDAWDDMVRDLQSDVADEVTEVFLAIDRARAEIRADVIELLAAEDLGVEQSIGSIMPLDVRELWQGKDLLEHKSGKKRAFEQSMTGIRGAQGGIMMFGIMSQFLPRAAAGLLTANPVMLGIGALFGGIGLADDRKRKVVQRRQTARTQVRQFVDDVQFEVGNQLSTVIRDLQRELRDEFTERLGELQRSVADVARRAQENAQRTQQERQARLAEIDQTITLLQQMEQKFARGAR